MNHTKKRWVRTPLAIVGALALGIGGLAVSAPAFAAGGAVSPNVGNIPDGPFTLNVTKYVQQTGAGNEFGDNDGTQQSPDANAKTISGVTFSVTPVTGLGGSNLDLTTADGWQAVADLAGHAPAQDAGGWSDNGTALTLGTPVTSRTTDGNGLAAFTGLPLGLYLVQETDIGANPITNRAAPFLVTLPLPHNNQWLSTVWAYPKNPETALTKTVDDSNAHGLGDTIDWTIQAAVPQLGSNSLTKFVVSDSLDSRLTYDDTAAPAVVTLVNGTTTTTVPAADYTVATGTDANQDAGAANFSVTFNQDGLTLLQANQGGSVHVLIPTTVTSIGSGTIQNTPLANINGSTVTGTPAQSTWGALQITKTDTSEAKNLLKGAEFQIFTSEDAAAKAGQADADPVSVNGTTTFTTGDDGTVLVDGLKAQNNGTGNDLTYYVVETKAPAGFTVATDYTPTNPQPVTITPGTLADAAQISAADPQVPALILPLTGGTGDGIFLAGGLLLVGLAVTGGLIATRRRKAADPAPAE